MPVSLADLDREEAYALHQELKEAEAREAHDMEDHDPFEWWGECSMCADDIANDIDCGIRCKHGEYVLDNRITDIPCKKCEESYEPLRRT